MPVCILPLPFPKYLTEIYSNLQELNKVFKLYMTDPYIDEILLATKGHGDATANFLALVSQIYVSLNYF